MLNKLIEKIKSITFTKKWEFRIRRIVELSTFGFGVALVIVGLLKIFRFSGSFMLNATELTVGLIAINIAYRGLVEDLPKVGVLLNKRRFWD